MVFCKKYLNDEIRVKIHLDIFEKIHKPFFALEQDPWSVTTEKGVFISFIYWESYRMNP